MTDDEKRFLEFCNELSRKEKINLITAINHMMDMDTEGTFYNANDNLTKTGLLMKDFNRLLRKRGEKK